MNKHYGLLKKIADEYAIIQGLSEPDKDYKARLIYSLLGMMSYASLWDSREDGEPISIIHFKSRIETILSSYVELYPEVDNLFPQDKSVVSNEIYDVFLKGGVLYHEPNRIVPADKKICICKRVAFYRGIAADIAQSVSGVGTYQKDCNAEYPLSVEQMYQIDPTRIEDIWDRSVARADFRPNSIAQHVEYLRLNGPFKYGYWVDKPEKNVGVSILRTDSQGEKTYYLYRFEGNTLLTSQLPRWQVENYNYRDLSNGCLKVAKTLPPIRYSISGSIVYLNQDYLLPPAELNLIKLYSWPISYISLPRDFSRIMATEVFAPIKELFEQKGFEFVEEK